MSNYTDAHKCGDCRYFERKTPREGVCCRWQKYRVVDGLRGACASFERDAAEAPRPTGPEGRKGRDLDRLNLHLAANGDCWAEPDGRHLEPERREVDGDGLLHYGFPLLEPRDAKPSRMVAFTVGLMGDEAGKALFEEGASEACRRLSPSRVLAFGTPHGFDAHGAEVAWYESGMQARFRKMRDEKKAERKEVEHGTRKRQRPRAGLLQAARPAHPRRGRAPSQAQEVTGRPGPPAHAAPCGLCDRRKRGFPRARNPAA